MSKLWKSFELWTGREIFDGARRNMGSGAVNSTDTGEPRTGDVIHPNYEVECKVYKRIAIFRWWEKVAEEAKASGKIPHLVMREKGNARDTLVAIHWEHYVELKNAWELANGMREGEVIEND